MNTLNLFSQLFWLLVWDLCYCLLHKPSVLLAHLTTKLCNNCMLMVVRLEAERLEAVLRKGREEET